MTPTQGTDMGGAQYTLTAERAAGESNWQLRKREHASCGHRPGAITKYVPSLGVTWRVPDGEPGTLALAACVRACARACDRYIEAGRSVIRHKACQWNPIATQLEFEAVAAARSTSLASTTISAQTASLRNC